MSDSVLKPIDAAGLWRVDYYTDMGNGDLRVFTPVLVTGEPDPMRQQRFYSSCQANYKGRAQIVPFEIEAKSIEEAIAGFVAAGELAATQFVEKMRDMDRRANILVPHGGIPN